MWLQKALADILRATEIFCLPVIIAGVEEQASRYQIVKFKGYFFGPV
jgi:hypothetical protein